MLSSNVAQRLLGFPTIVPKGQPIQTGWIWDTHISCREVGSQSILRYDAPSGAAQKPLRLWMVVPNAEDKEPNEETRFRYPCPTFFVPQASIFGARQQQPAPHSYY